MTVYSTSCALISDSFPFNLLELATPVLVARSWEKGDTEKRSNQCHAFFMQNCLPVANGFNSVHYTKVINKHTYPQYLDRCFALRTADGQVALYSPASGTNYIYTKATGNWEKFPFVTSVDSSAISIAYLKGTTYVCYPGIGLFVYDFDTNTFNQQTVIAVDFNNIKGVCAAGGYLLLWTDTSIAWSSLTNPLDFTPTTGGAGSSSLLSARGPIVTVLPAKDGVVVYTSVNAVAGNVTGNINFPFAFKEIAGSAGLATSRHATGDSTAETQIAWTTSGIMEVGGGNAQAAWAEISDSIAQNIYMSCGSDGYPYLSRVTQIDVSINTIGQRYITISLKNKDADVEYAFAYVYDLVLRRWGRIDIPHIDIFEYRAPEFVKDFTYDDLGEQTYDDLGELTYDQLSVKLENKTAQFGTTFGIVNALGAVHIALGSQVKNLDTLEDATSGAAVPKLMLGRYRLIRPNAIQSISFDVNAAANTAGIKVIAHDEQGDFIRSVGTVTSPRSTGKWFARCTGASLSVDISGRFCLTGANFSFVDAGDRNLPKKISTTDGNTITIDGVPVSIDGQVVVET